MMNEMNRLPTLALLLTLSCGGGSDSDAGRDTGMDASPPATDTGVVLSCEELGGTCGCVGSCAGGSTADPILARCPQPCAECGGCSQECCLPNDGGGADAHADASATDAGCTELEWGLSTLVSLGASCGVTPTEGAQLCLQITVDADGIVTDIAEGPSSGITVDAAAQTCIEGMVLGMCVPLLAGRPPNELCAYGV